MIRKNVQIRNMTVSIEDDNERILPAEFLPILAGDSVDQS